MVYLNGVKKIVQERSISMKWIDFAYGILMAFFPFTRDFHNFEFKK